MGCFSFTNVTPSGLIVVTPKVFGDARGYFYESYNKVDFVKAGITAEFVQDNESRSAKGVLRGLHFQKKHPQGKLVRVSFGTVFDVAVDIRKNSDTYGAWFGIMLNGEDKKQLYIPPGFAHGFIVLSDYAVFNYKCTDYYHPEDQDGILWNDPDIGIDWQYDGQPLLSDKDKYAKSLKQLAQ